MDKRHCKICKDLKIRELVGKFNDKDKKYVNENKRLWNGNVCPDCVVKQSRERMKTLRQLRKLA